MKTERTSARQTFFLPGIIILLLFAFAFQGSRGIWEPDEGRYIAVALNMSSSGDFLVPRLNDTMAHFDKPPLTYWLIAASIKLFGMNEWAARVPNGLAFFLTCLFIYGIGIRLVSEKPWLSVLIYATCVFPFAAANIVTTDTLLALWETIAVFGFLAGVLSRGESRRRLFFDLMWTGFGLAFLTKGPPGLLPLLAIIVYSCLTGGARGLGKILVPEGVLAFLVIGFSWYVAVVIKNRELFTYFLREEFINRMATAVHNRNPEWYMPFVIYLPVIVLGSFPWTMVILRDSVRFPGLFRKEYWRGKLRDDGTGLFLILWFALPLIVFCLAASRLPLYILPLFVPLSILIARRLKPGGILGRRVVRNGLIVWAVFMLAAKGMLGGLASSRDSRGLARSIKEQIKEPFERIIFVDKRPHYGLRFYLGLDVGRVTMYDKGPSPAEPKSELPFKEEIGALEAGAKDLLVVALYDYEAFRLVTGRLGYRPEYKGRWGKLYFFTLVKNS